MACFFFNAISLYYYYQLLNVTSWDLRSKVSHTQQVSQRGTEVSVGLPTSLNALADSQPRSFPWIEVVCPGCVRVSEAGGSGKSS